MGNYCGKFSDGSSNVRKRYATRFDVSPNEFQGSPTVPRRSTVIRPEPRSAHVRDHDPVVSISTTHNNAVETDRTGPKASVRPNQHDSEPSAPRQTPKAPTSWTLGKLIGAGTYGRVFSGLNNNTGEIIAIKQVPLTKEESLRGQVAEHIKLLESEVNLLSKLNHENIVQYLGTECSNENLNIFLEYVAGGSIASLIEKFGPLPESVVRLYTKQILRGLEYLHKRQIIHRDIKGANILVDGNGTVKLADFGASKQIETLATVGSGAKSIKGTPFWMAPEIIQQVGHSLPADIWSLGCVVIEMATGKPPWNNCTTPLAVMFRIASSKEPPALPDFLTPEAKDFILLCFNRVPKERPNATRLLKHPFITTTLPTAISRPVTPHLPLQLSKLPPSPIKEEQISPSLSPAAGKHRSSPRDERRPTPEFIPPQPILSRFAPPAPENRRERSPRVITQVEPTVASPEKVVSSPTRASNASLFKMNTEMSPAASHSSFAAPVVPQFQPPQPTQPKPSHHSLDMPAFEDPPLLTDEYILAEADDTRSKVEAESTLGSKLQALLRAVADLDKKESVAEAQPAHHTLEQQPFNLTLNFNPMEEPSLPSGWIPSMYLQLLHHTVSDQGQISSDKGEADLDDVRWRRSKVRGLATSEDDDSLADTRVQLDQPSAESPRLALNESGLGLKQGYKSQPAENLKHQQWEKELLAEINMSRQQIKMVGI